MPDKMIMSRCPVCGASLERYTLKSLTSLFRITGGFYTHQCINCNTKFAPSTFVLLVTVLALGQIDIRESNLNIVAGVFLILAVFVFSLAYRRPGSGRKKAGEDQE